MSGDPVEFSNSLKPFHWFLINEDEMANWCAPQPTPEFLAQKRRDSACQWFAQHYRQRAAESGVFVAAKQLRKQGVPLDVAVSILATR